MTREARLTRGAAFIAARWFVYRPARVLCQDYFFNILTVCAFGWLLDKPPMREGGLPAGVVEGLEGGEGAGLEVARVEGEALVP